MLTLIDIAKLIAAVAATIALTLLWIHKSAQQQVDRSTVHSVKVALRLLLIHALAIGVLCVVYGLSVNVYLVITAMVCAMTMLGPGGDDPVSFAFWLLLVVPGYILKQFVLGFPDRDEVFLKPPAVPTRSDPPSRQADTGTVVATLRPMGKVDLAGEQFNAVSAYGKMIDVGTPIRVCGSRGDVLLVAESTEKSPAG